MKIYLQYPFRFPDSPYYKYLIKNPPKDIEFTNTKRQKGVITSKNRFKLVSKLKNVARKVLYLLKRPNITTTPKGDYDLIHCCHCLSNNQTNWVVDVEHYWNFASSGELAYSDKGKKIISSYLKSPYCKKILAWSKACKNAINEALRDKDIDNKIEVVYPAVKPKKFKKKKSDKIKLLFVGRYFYGKGGEEIFPIFDLLNLAYDNLECIVVSDVPEEYKELYGDEMRIYDMMPQKELFKLFEEADIFVYGGYSDTFGFALLEAMSFGLPVVTADGFARREIVEEGKNGYVIPTGKVTWRNGRPEFDKENYIVEMVYKTSNLISNKRLREKMGKAGLKEITSGKFSIAKRNKMLRKIYK